MATAKTPVTPLYAGDLTAYNSDIDQGLAANSILANQFQPHESGTPNMAVVIEAGNAFTGAVIIAKAQQTTTTITAPLSNPRIDRIAVDKYTGSYVIISGTEAASPVAKNYGVNHIPVCQFRLENTTTTISNSTQSATNSQIIDERGINFAPTGGQVLSAIMSSNFSVGASPGDVTFNEIVNNPFSIYASGKITPKIAGYYYVNISLTHTASMYFRLQKNTLVIQDVPGDASRKQTALSALAYLNGSTDYIKFDASGTGTIYGPYVDGPESTLAFFGPF